MIWVEWVNRNVTIQCFCYKRPPVDLIARLSRKTGLLRQQCHCPTYGHMLYCDLALFHYPYEGVSGCPPRPGWTIDILIHENSCWYARRRNVSSEEVCIQEKCSAHAALADLRIEKREQLLFITDSRSSWICCPIGNWCDAIPDSCSWAIPPALLRICFQIVLWWVTIPKLPFVEYNNIPYSRRGHDEQKARLGWQIYRKFARQYVHRDVTSLLLNVPVT